MEPLGGELRRELRRLGPAGALTELARGWPELVGPAIARNAWPARTARDGTLHVTTSSAAWAHELTQLAPELLERLRGALGAQAPPRLRFAVGAVPEPPGEEAAEAAPKVVAPRAEDRARAAELAAGLADEELRALVARAAAASLARGGDDRPV